MHHRSTGNLTEELGGGNSGRLIERVGNLVRRPAAAWTSTIHSLLSALRDRGIGEVPEPVSIEGDSELVSFIPGTVANYPLPDWLWSPTVLVEATSLLRRMHDATARLEIPGAIWQLPSHEPMEVICHNDFAPYNLVFDDEHHLVGVLDFDTASPGPRIWDFAYLAYRLVPFCSDAGESAPGDSEVEQRLAAAIHAYGEPFTANEVLEVMASRLEDLAKYTMTRATREENTDLAGHAAMYLSDVSRIRSLAMRTGALPPCGEAR